MAARTQPFPMPAVTWMTGREQRVLLVGAARGVPRMLTDLGHRVTVIDPSLVALQRACPTPLPGVTPMAARVESLPFDPWCFDVALFCQNLHDTGERTLAEVTRVLAPGGRVAVVYTTRDDTVPWVRRLAALLRDVDPDAMSGDYGATSVERIDASRYFPAVERATFRTWFPVTRDALAQMVARRPRVAALPTERRDALLASVGDLYDQMARGPHLLLPYEAACTRAAISHDELTEPIRFEDGLRIL